MAEAAAGNVLLSFSNALADLIERAGPSVVGIAGGRGAAASGVHWRAGIIVTAEEALESDDEITILRPNGTKDSAALIGRDPSTDIAALRFQPDGLPVAETGDAASLRTGNLVLAVGRQRAGTVARLGVASLASGAWQSLRGGTIDRLLRLDLAAGPAIEGGALLDASGKVLGMAVSGPRRRVLGIPASTIDRVLDELLAKGRIARAYLGAGLMPVRATESAEPARRGVLVVSLDPQGPAAKAGLLVGDILIAWDGQPIQCVREVMRLLMPDRVGKAAALQLLRGGAALSVTAVIGERPAG